MPTVMAYHDVKDKNHWLASSKREEFFYFGGPHLGAVRIGDFTLLGPAVQIYTPRSRVRRGQSVPRDPRDRRVT